MAESKGKGESVVHLSDTQLLDVESGLLPIVVLDNHLRERVQESLRETRSLQRTLDVFKSEGNFVLDRVSLLLPLLEIIEYDVDLLVQILQNPPLDDFLSASTAHDERSLGFNILAIRADAIKIPEEKEASWTCLRARLFALYPTEAVRALLWNEVLPAPAGLAKGVSSFLEDAVARLGFNIARDSVKHFMEREDVKNSIQHIAGFSQDEQSLIEHYLETIQHLQALVNEPDDIAALYKCNFTSANQIALAGSHAIDALIFQGVPRDRAEHVINYANVVSFRNEGLLIEALRARRETGYDDILNASSLGDDDGDRNGTSEKQETQETRPPDATEINMSTMFDLKSMGCEDCASITSPTAFFVHLLHTLHNIQLPKDSTMLVTLFARRPDLGDLELSCANAKIPIPYIDLVNEMLESVVWHLAGHGNLMKTDIRIDVRNSNEKENDDEADAWPSHVDYRVYSEVVQKMVFPMQVFPFNQAIDSIRAYLEVLHSSRFELLSKLSSPYWIEQNGSKDAIAVIDRALAAESLNLQHEDYVSVCGESFYGPSFPVYRDGNKIGAKYFDIIGRRETWEHWGYIEERLMLADETGLTLIEAQLLPRSGLTFQDLLAILKTKFFMASLVIESSNPKLGSPSFTGELKDMRLRRLLIGGKTQQLDTEACQRLLSFLRLRNKIQWTIDEFDALLVTVALNAKGFQLVPCINPEVLAGLAAVKQLSSLTNVSPTELQPFWGEINTHGPLSLYHQRFLRGRLPPDEQRIFQLAENGDILPGSKISDYLHILTRAMRATPESLHTIMSIFKLPDVLNLSNISLLYRVNLICKILRISPTHYRRIRSSCIQEPDPFESPQDTIDFVQKIKGLLSDPDPWTIDELLIVLESGSLSQTGTFALKREQVIQFAVSLFSGIKAAGLSKEHVVARESTKEALNEQVRELVIQLFGSQIGVKIARFVNNPTVKNGQDGQALFTKYLTTIIGAEKTKTLLAKLSRLEMVLESDNAHDVLAKFEKQASNWKMLPKPLWILNELRQCETDALLEFDHIKMLLMRLLTPRTFIDDSEIGPSDSVSTSLNYLFSWDKSLAPQGLQRLEDLAKSETAMGHEEKKLLNEFLNGLDNRSDRLASRCHNVLYNLTRDEITLGLDSNKGLQRLLVSEAYLISHGKKVLEKLLREETHLTPSGKETIREILDSNISFYHDGQHLLEDLLKSRTAEVHPDGRNVLDEVLQSGYAFMKDKEIFLQTIDSPAEQDVVSDLGPALLTEGLATALGDEAKEKVLTWLSEVAKLLQGGGDLWDLPKPDTTGKRSKLFLDAVLPTVIEMKKRKVILDSLNPHVFGLDPLILEFSLSAMPTAKSAGSGGDAPGLQSGMDSLLALTETTGFKGKKFSGYFVPPRAGRYVFSLKESKSKPSSPPDLVFDDLGLRIAQGSGRGDSPHCIITNTLVAGHHYHLRYEGCIEDVVWTIQGAVGADPVAFSQLTLVPDSTIAVISDVLSKLLGLSTALIKLKLDMPEFLFWQRSKKFDFSNINWKDLLELRRYSILKREFSGNEAKQPLHSLYQWLFSHGSSHKVESSAEYLAQALAKVTAWPEDICLNYLEAKYPRTDFDHAASGGQLYEIFHEVSALFEMREALELVDKLSLPRVSLRSLFAIASPPLPPTTKKDFENAASLRLGIQSRFAGSHGAGGGQTALATMHDTLRTKRRDALVQCLLEHDYSKRHKLTDPNKLFSHFLIDVQMGPVLQTSRIIQAISAIQLFIQRCRLGLEKGNGISRSMLAQYKLDWDSMMQYRLWEANRKIFLYPENWLDPTLRDDKSEQFKSLESVVLQTKLDSEKITGLVKKYIHDINDISDLQIESYLWDRHYPDHLDRYEATFHFFGRNRTSPPTYYYRRMELSGSGKPGRGSESGIIAYWSPWTKADIEVSLQASDGASMNLARPGCYMIPAKFKGRLLVFLPEIRLAQEEKEHFSGKDTIEQISKRPLHKSQPDHQWEIRLGYVEYRNGEWSAKKVADAAITVPSDSPSSQKAPPDISSFKFWVQTRTRKLSEEKKQDAILRIHVERLRGGTKKKGYPSDKKDLESRSLFLGLFEMRDQQLVLVGPEKLPVVSWSYEESTDEGQNPETYTGFRQVRTMILEVGSEASTAAFLLTKVIPRSNQKLKAAVEGTISKIREAQSLSRVAAADVERGAKRPEQAIKSTENAVRSIRGATESTRSLKSSSMSSTELVDDPIDDIVNDPFKAEDSNQDAIRQLISISISAMNKADDLVQKACELLKRVVEMTGGHTVPTTFSRLHWSVLEGQDIKPPGNMIEIPANSSGHVVKPLLGFIKGKAISTTQFSWVMSFDSINYKAPSAFVFDVSTDKTDESYFTYPPQLRGLDNKEMLTYEHDKYFNHVAPQLAQATNLADGLAPVYECLTNLDRASYKDAFGGRLSGIWHERSTPNAIYNWELGVHIPSLLMERLMAIQQLDLALEVARLVFNPNAKGTQIDRCWSFPPFKDELVRTGKGKDFDDRWMKMREAEWRACRNNPHASARGNPSAYMKRFVIKYIEILVAAGDEQFRRNTLESVPLAIQRYTEALHIFGPALVQTPQLGKRPVKTFNQIQKDLKAGENPTVKMDLYFPFWSDPGQRGVGCSNMALNHQPIGFINTKYFGIPGNPALVKLRLLIEDRLYKIRNGLDIDGNKRTLSLLAPPIDPGAVARANAGQGGGVSGLLAGLDGPMPKYRFRYILQRAFELAAELKNSGQQLLAIKEKKDVEALISLRAQHRIKMSQLSTNIEVAQKAELEKAIESLQITRKQHEMRLGHYIALTGDRKEVPMQDAKWTDIIQSYGKVTINDNIRMSPEEAKEAEHADEVALQYKKASTLDILASLLYAIPNFTANIQPLGVGASISIGGQSLGSIANCGANVARMLAQKASADESKAARHGYLIRQLQERRLQANTIGYDLMRIDQDMKQLRARVTTCEQRIQAQKDDLENAKAEERWLQSKYSSVQLYAMMESSLRTFFHQTFLMASSMARTAKRALDFEHAMRYPNHTTDQDGASFLDASLNLHGGQFLGEALFLDLKRLEAMHMENQPHDFEIQKTVSLRQVDPWALLELRETGEANLNVTETLFDMDFPGHYGRRIVGVEISLPCVIGPFASLNCTLSLQSHRYRISPLASDADAYNKAADRDEAASFRTDRIPITSVAVGGAGMQQSGMFNLNFASSSSGGGSERYNPFEGAGAISQWRIKLPPKIRPFDYGTITDVLVHLRYTALQGGEALGRIAQEASLKRLLEHRDGIPNVVALDLRNDYPTEWNYVVGSKDEKSVFHLPNLKSGMLPYWTQRANTVTAKSISLLIPTSASKNVPQSVRVEDSKGTWAVDLKKGSGSREVSGFLTLSCKDVNEDVTDLWQIVGLGKTDIKRAWLMIAYTVNGLGN